MHFQPGLTEDCINHSWYQVNLNLDSLASVRRMTIVGGDFNQRPDKWGELPTNGLETDPNCWYRRASTAHLNQSLVAAQDCGANPTYDRYYDVVWAYPGSGGGTNPTATSFCEQFTYVNDVDLLGSPPDPNDATNSCTDANLNGVLDKGRIDYLWTSYEGSTGSAWKPPHPVISGLIEFASADLGLSLDAGTLASSYADHRAVQAVLTWPAAMLP